MNKDYFGADSVEEQYTIVIRERNYGKWCNVILLYLEAKRKYEVMGMEEHYQAVEAYENVLRIFGVKIEIKEGE